MCVFLSKKKKKGKWQIQKNKISITIISNDSEIIQINFCAILKKILNTISNRKKNKYEKNM